MVKAVKEEKLSEKITAFDTRCQGFVKSKTIDEDDPERMVWDCALCDEHSSKCNTADFYDSVKGHATRHHSQGDKSFLAVVFNEAYVKLNTMDVDDVAKRLAIMVSLPLHKKPHVPGCRNRILNGSLLQLPPPR